MKQEERDLERFAAIVREYNRQDASDPVRRSRSYRDACDALQDEIGEVRMWAARDEYDERQFRACEAREDKWIESHYR